MKAAKQAPVKKPRHITVATACARMKERLNVDITPQRMRQILIDQRNRDDGIKSFQLFNKGWWYIDPDSFDRYLERQQNGGYEDGR